MNSYDQVWKNEGATIVSHIDAYDYIKDNPTQDLVLPDMKWIGCIKNQRWKLIWLFYKSKL